MDLKNRYIVDTLIAQHIMGWSWTVVGWDQSGEIEGWKDVNGIEQRQVPNYQSDLNCAFKALEQALVDDVITSYAVTDSCVMVEKNVEQDDGPMYYHPKEWKCDLDPDHGIHEALAICLILLYIKNHQIPEYSQFVKFTESNKYA